MSSSFSDVGVSSALRYGGGPSGRSCNVCTCHYYISEVFCCCVKIAVCWVLVQAVPELVAVCRAGIEGNVECWPLCSGPLVLFVWVRGVGSGPLEVSSNINTSLSDLVERSSVAAQFVTISMVLGLAKARPRTNLPYPVG